MSLASRAETAPLKSHLTSLGGISVQVVDSSGTARLAPLFYTSPTRIDFQTPAGSTVGSASVSILSGSTVLQTATASILAVAPALYTANGDGKGGGYRAGCRWIPGEHGASQYVDIALPSSMRGMGESDLALVADGYQANTVRLNIQ